MARNFRCELCGEPMEVCGGCGFRHKVYIKPDFRKGYADLECPNETFEFEKDIYNKRHFQRRVHREAARRERGYTDVDDLFESDKIHDQCPYCDTWFPFYKEMIDTKSTLYTGQVPCPCCHKICKVGKAGVLEQM